MADVARARYTSRNRRGDRTTARALAAGDRSAETGLTRISFYRSTQSSAENGNKRERATEHTEHTEHTEESGPFVFCVIRVFRGQTLRIDLCALCELL